MPHSVNYFKIVHSSYTLTTSIQSIKRTAFYDRDCHIICILRLSVIVAIVTCRFAAEFLTLCTFFDLFRYHYVNIVQQQWQQQWLCGSVHTAIMAYSLQESTRLIRRMQTVCLTAASHPYIHMYEDNEKFSGRYKIKLKCDRELRGISLRCSDIPDNSCFAGPSTP